MKYLILASIHFLFACASTENFNYENYKMKNTNDNSELIVLASTKDNDNYYADYDAKIFNFHVNFAKQILENGDQAIIFSSDDKIKKYQKALPDVAIIDLAMDDIWMRDFSLSNLNDPIKFRYSAAGQGGGAQGQVDSDIVQKHLFSEIGAAGLNFKTTNLINDGGNWVDNGKGLVILSDKFLKDNNLNAITATSLLKKEYDVKAIFIQADEQGGLEHADGVVSFIEPNKLIMNSYPEDKAYSNNLKSKIKQKFPDVEILELPTPYDGKNIHDSKFGSACGLYTNALVTSKNIYLPQFGIPEDLIAVEMISKFTKKNIVPVMSEAVCKMGGGIRCMSWQLSGQNKDKLLRHFLE